MNKDRIKRLIFNCQIRITSLIHEGVVNRANKQTVIRSVRSEILKMKLLSDAERNQLWYWAVKLYKRMVVAAGRKKDTDERSSSIYANMKDDVKDLEHTKNSIANDYEYRKKHDDLISDLRSGSRFFYCTVLPDPAPDHAAYQGKIYYNDDAEFTDAEKDYINKYNLLSIREVTLSLPYLCTRPNCRHRLVPIEKNHKLIKQHNMTYEEIQYRNYFDRYKYLKAIGATNDELKQTRLLIRKWYRAWKNK